MNKKNQGSVLIDLLLALGLSLALLGIFSNLLGVYSRIRLDGETLQNRMGLVQLQYYLMLAHDFQIEGDELRYLIAEEEFVLRISNKRLIQQPGTLIFLLGIEDCEFYWEEGSLMINYQYKERHLTSILVYGEAE